jgi:hypothetical protein
MGPGGFSEFGSTVYWAEFRKTEDKPVPADCDGDEKTDFCGFSSV